MLTCHTSHYIPVFCTPRTPTSHTHIPYVHLSYSHIPYSYFPYSHTYARRVTLPCSRLRSGVQGDLPPPQGYQGFELVARLPHQGGVHCMSCMQQVWAPHVWTRGCLGEEHGRCSFLCVLPPRGNAGTIQHHRYQRCSS